MPELPEVSIIVSQLGKKLKGLVLESIEYDWPKKFFWAAGPEWPLARRGDKWVLDLKGAKVEKVERMGKVVIIDLTKTGPVSRFLPASARSKQKSIGDQKDNVELCAVGSPSAAATRPPIL